MRGVLQASGSGLRALAFGFLASGFALARAPVALPAAQEPGPGFVPIVMMVGCVEDDGRGGFLLTSATDPVELDDRVPDEPGPTAPVGDGRVRLVGTLDEFGVGDHATHKVRVRGLFAEAESQSDSESRLNLTSIMMLAPACP